MPDIFDEVAASLATAGGFPGNYAAGYAGQALPKKKSAQQRNAEREQYLRKLQAVQQLNSPFGPLSPGSQNGSNAIDQFLGRSSNTSGQNLNLFNPYPGLQGNSPKGRGLTADKLAGGGTPGYASSLLFPSPQDIFFGPNPPRPAPKTAPKPYSSAPVRSSAGTGALDSLPVAGYYPDISFGGGGSPNSVPQFQFLRKPSRPLGTLLQPTQPSFLQDDPLQRILAHRANTQYEKMTVGAHTYYYDPETGDTFRSGDDGGHLPTSLRQRQTMNGRGLSAVGGDLLYGSVIEPFGIPDILMGRFPDVNKMAFAALTMAAPEVAGVGGAKLGARFGKEALGRRVAANTANTILGGWGAYEEGKKGVETGDNTRIGAAALLALMAAVPWMRKGELSPFDQRDLEQKAGLNQGALSSQEAQKNLASRVDDINAQRTGMGANRRSQTQLGDNNNTQGNVKRVRHYTTEDGLVGIKRSKSIYPAREKDGVVGVHVETDPFGPMHGAAEDLGAAIPRGKPFGYVEFNAPEGLRKTYEVGPRNTGVIPSKEAYNISELDPEYKRFAFWRRLLGIYGWRY